MIPYSAGRDSQRECRDFKPYACAAAAWHAEAVAKIKEKGRTARDRPQGDHRWNQGFRHDDARLSEKNPFEIDVECQALLQGLPT
jgi:hypothetical protein